MIGDRIIKIKNQLANVVRTRELHRATRREVPYPLVALVGYTNAGKSTLFNRLTKADVMAQDMLFATLDPTIRGCTLPGGMKVMLSDTVGFISNLPTELIAAFRATLEEVLNADLLLHVRDIAHEDSDAQRSDVLGVLKELFGKDHALDHLIEVHNKIDLLPEGFVPPYPGDVQTIGVSAVTGEGIPDLLAIIEDALSRQLMDEQHYTVLHTDGRAMAWLHANAQVLERKDMEEHAVFKVLITPANHARYTRQFG